MTESQFSPMKTVEEIGEEPDEAPVPKRPRSWSRGVGFHEGEAKGEQLNFTGIARIIDGQESYALLYSLLLCICKW